MRTRWHCTLSDAVNSVRMERERADWVMPAVPFLVPDGSSGGLARTRRGGHQRTSLRIRTGALPALLTARPDRASVAGLSGAPPARALAAPPPRRRRRVFAHLPPRINARPSSIPFSG